MNPKKFLPTQLAYRLFWRTVRYNIYLLFMCVAVGVFCAARDWVGLMLAAIPMGILVYMQWYYLNCLVDEIHAYYLWRRSSGH